MSAGGSATGHGSGRHHAGAAGGPAARDRPQPAGPASPDGSPDADGNRSPDADGNRSAAHRPEPDLVITVGGNLTPAPGDDATPAAERRAAPAAPGAPAAARPSRPARSSKTARSGKRAVPTKTGGPTKTGRPTKTARPAPRGRHGAASSRPPAGGAGAAGLADPEDELTRWAGDYAASRPGQQISIMLAGCVTAGTDLGAARLRAAGYDVTVTLVDDDQPVTRAAVRGQPALARCILGDLRIVPIPPRSCDLVLCSLLLDRVRHAELVLDRLATAVKPGGVLLLRVRDRDCAAGFLDRMLPEMARRLVWRRRWPGLPGPHPAIYEPLSSARGIGAYAQLRGLVVAEKRACDGRPGAPSRPSPGGRASRQLVSWLSRGRLPATHDELLYILRKPEDPFARVL